MLASFWKFSFNGAPWIFTKLLDGQAHLAIALIKRYNLCLILITKLEEFLCVDGRIRPRNFAYVNKTFHTWKYFEEGAIIFYIYNSSFYNLTFFDVLRKNVPWMRRQLLQAQTDTFFLIIEIQYHNIDLLIKLQHFARMRDTTP